MHKNNSYSVKLSKQPHLLNKAECFISEMEIFINTIQYELEKLKINVHKNNYRSYIKTEKELDEYYKSIGL